MTEKSAPIPEQYHNALTDYREGRVPQAVEKLRAVLLLDKRFEDAYEALAVILYNQKEYDAAIHVLKQWVAVNPDSIMAHTNLSRCYVAKEMIAEAEHEQAEARRLTWKAQLKEKKQALPQEDYPAKIEKYKKIIEFDPADVLGYFSLGSVYLECGKKREAMDTFQKAIEVNPGHTSSYVGLGQALESLGDIARAVQIYEKGIRVADKNGDMMPQKKMETRLRALTTPGQA